MSNISSSMVQLYLHVLPILSQTFATKVSYMQNNNITGCEQRKNCQTKLVLLGKWFAMFFTLLPRDD